MKCLTPKEIQQWIYNAQQIEDPYTGSVAPKHRLQFYAPENYSKIECFVRCFISEVIGKSDLLLVVTDAEPSEESQIFVHEALRFFAQEARPVMEAPGYLITADKLEQAVAIFSLTCCFGWKCYLYGKHDQIVLYNWEGTIFDVWTSSDTKREQSLQIIANFGFKPVNGADGH